MNKRFGSLALAWTVAAALVTIKANGQAQTTSVPRQHEFNSPAEAAQALKAATQNQDKRALQEVFGPGIQQMLTGDEKLDSANFKRFSEATSERCVPIQRDQNTVVFEIGPSACVFPIPLVQQGGRWRFDTDAGMDEIVNRHIGRNELHAIAMCRAFVEGEREYGARHVSSEGASLYARNFNGSIQRRSPTVRTEAEELPPTKELFAEPEDHSNLGLKELTCSGYRFKILTRQGKAAAGGRRNFVSHGELTRGFALVAYPVAWGKSGVMTFIVNQDGQVFQQDLGTSTAASAAKMKEYNPTPDWTPAKETGIAEN